MEDEAGERCATLPKAGALQRLLAAPRVRNSRTTEVNYFYEFFWPSILIWLIIIKLYSAFINLAFLEEITGTLGRRVSMFWTWISEEHTSVGAHILLLLIYSKA